MLVTVLGMDTVIRPVQLWNALEPIVVTVSGMIIPDNTVQ